MVSSQTANIHPETGIAYGYISANALDSDVVDELMYGAQAINETEQEAREEFIREWRSKVNDGSLDEDEPDDYEWQEFWDRYEEYEPVVHGELEGVKYASSWLGGTLNFFIFESPHITDKARTASPCVPNCGILDELDGDVRSYDVPPEWRRKD